MSGHRFRTTAYRTMDDQQLLDLEYDALQQNIEVRCGTSLKPDERPIVLTLSPADAVWLIENIKAIYFAHPVDMTLQLALDDHRRGATHDCGEWAMDGLCQLCKREVRR